jgi:hypothetical protein
VPESSISDEPPPNFRILKIVVVVLGIAILGMTGIIIVKGVEKFNEGEARATAEPAAPATVQAPVATFPAGEAWVADIGDGRILESRIDGGLLMMLIEAPDGTRRVEIRDLPTGRLRGTASPR